jgi:hypothetical protein
VTPIKVTEYLTSLKKNSAKVVSQRPSTQISPNEDLFDFINDEFIEELLERIPEELEFSPEEQSMAMGEKEISLAHRMIRLHLEALERLVAERVKGSKKRKVVIQFFRKLFEDLMNRIKNAIVENTKKYLDRYGLKENIQNVNERNRNIILKKMVAR